MSCSTLAYLQHILDETEYLMDSLIGFTRIGFSTDGTLKHAFMRGLEIIGEAAEQIPDNVGQMYSHLEPRAMAGVHERRLWKFPLPMLLYDS